MKFYWYVVYHTSTGGPSYQQCCCTIETEDSLFLPGSAREGLGVLHGIATDQVLLVSWVPLTPVQYDDYCTHHPQPVRNLSLA
jgi:hypothetical protein